MRGVSGAVEQVLTAISKLDLCKNFTLIGGTALSLSIGHRLSEDIDLCSWDVGMSIDSDSIVGSLKKMNERFELKQITNAENQIDLLINGVKVTSWIRLAIGLTSGKS